VKTLGWFAILLAIYLVRAAFHGHIIDETGKFVLLDNMGATITALITNDTAALAALDSAPSSGINAPAPAPPVPVPGAPGTSGAPASPGYIVPQGPMGPTPSIWASNPKSVNQMIGWCENQIQKGMAVYYRRCLAFCANAYGLAGSGTTYAIDIWSQMPGDMRHPGDTNPPVGALLLYQTGSRAGHIAIAAQNGMVYSTDIKRRGHVDKVRFSDMTSGIWHLKYVGWTPPYFPHNSNSKRVGK